MNEHVKKLREIATLAWNSSARNEERRAITRALNEMANALEARVTKPIDMVLHCPACLEQHIDGPEPEHHRFPASPEPWDNPPHRSHLCLHCGHIWRPADVPTNGVLETKTHGKNDMVMFDGPAEVMRRLRAQAKFGRGQQQQLDPDWGT